MMFKILPEIHNVNALVFDAIWAEDFHCCRTHELLHVLNGHLELIFSDGQRFFAEVGDTLLVPRGSWHKDFFRFEDELKILMVQFCWEEFETYFAAVGNARINQLRPEIRTELRWVFERMRDGVGGGELDRMVESTRLMNILILIYRELHRQEEPEPSVSARHELILAARRYIERNFAKPLRLEDVAAHLKISPFYLSRVFSQESDFSLYEYLTEVRIHEAKRLLRDGRLLVSEVAERTGYDNGNYFAKVFRRRVGCPPGKFR